MPPDPTSEDEPRSVGPVTTRVGRSTTVLEAAERARARAEEALFRATKAEERARTSMERAGRHDDLVRQVAAALLSVTLAPTVADAITERGLDPARARITIDDVASNTGEIHLTVTLGGALSDARDASTGPRSGLAQATLRSADRARRYTEERRARDTLEAMIQQMPVGVLVVDAPDGRVVLANEGACRLIGVAALEWSDVAAYDPTRLRTVSGRPIGGGDWPIIRALRTGRSTLEQQLRSHAPDGTERHVLVSAAPVSGPSGSVSGAVQVMVDVTVRQEATLAREAILGILSHELRTPVTTLLGGSELLLDRWPSLSEGDREDLMRGNVAESQRLSAIIDNMLVLARVDAGVEMVDRHPILVQRAAARVVAREGRRFPTVTFDLVADAGLPAAMGDESAVEQVLANLLTNAAKYGPSPGTVRVELTQGRREVEVRVLDRGPGLAEQDIPELFRLFVRGAGVGDAASGAGIGLYVASRLISGMGGRLWAANRPDGGAEFGFALSLVDARARDPS